MNPHNPRAALKNCLRIAILLLVAPNIYVDFRHAADLAIRARLQSQINHAVARKIRTAGNAA